MLQFPWNIFWAAMKQMTRVFVTRRGDSEAVIRRLVAYGLKARKTGILSLDEDLGTVADPFLRQALQLAIDGTEPNEVRKIMQLDLDHKAEFAEQMPQVLEAAGGYAPTVGIIGAVLGLIQVMQHLDDISAVGRGIAVAFVATIYGVGLANLILLPVAGKMKIRQREDQALKTIMLEGVIAILEGMNPRMIETKLRAYLFDAKAGTANNPQARSDSAFASVPLVEEIEVEA